MPRLPRVEALAAAAGVGRRTLERRFEATLGVSPVQHLRWLRFERARRLLDGGGRAHAHVALDAGYADQAHFIREFARFSGLTPGRWPG
nr:helix-turn-helix transcriptional regulator [Coralloluteibacterium stylophorae]